MVKTSVAMLAFVLGATSAQDSSPFSENSQTWFGTNHFASDGTTVLKDIKGYTGWTTTGSGANKSVTY